MQGWERVIHTISVRKPLPPPKINIKRKKRKNGKKKLHDKKGESHVGCS